MKNAYQKFNEDISKLNLLNGTVWTFIIQNNLNLYLLYMIKIINNNWVKFISR